MAYSWIFLHPIRRSFTSIASSDSSSSQLAQLLCGKFEPLRTWIKRIHPLLHNHASISHCKSNVHRKYFQNFCFSGSKVIRSLLGVSFTFQSLSFWPIVSYAMDGHHTLVDGNRQNSFGASDLEEDSRTAWMFMRRFWLPIFFFLTVLVNWEHPIALLPKIILFLLSTKPSPLSVYVDVEKLCFHSMLQEPHLYKLKSLYANKVEVQDYKLLCLARVEVGDHKVTLLGILGSWWTLPS